MGTRIPIPCLDRESLGQAIENSSNVPLLVEFGSIRCGACKTLMFLMEKLKASKNISVGFVDTLQNPDLRRKYEIDHFPTTIMFYEGKILGHRLGSMSRDRLASFILNTLSANDAS